MKINRDRLKTCYPFVRLKSINVLLNNKVVYVENPKVGSSSIKLLLDKACCRDWSIDPRNVHTDRQIPPPGQVGWSKIESMLEGPSFVFTFVRNPADRVVSAYRDKMPKIKFRSKINETLGRADKAASVSFDDFLAALAQQTPAEMDPHWRPQADNVMIEAIKYDYVGKLELFDESLTFIKENSELPDVPTVHRNASKSKEEPSVDASQQRRIEEIYAVDYEKFDY